MINITWSPNKWEKASDLTQIKTLNVLLAREKNRGGKVPGGEEEGDWVTAKGGVR